MPRKDRKCPCINCICLPICNHLSSIEICEKCSDICDYVTVSNSTTGRYRWLKIIKAFNVEEPFTSCPIRIKNRTIILNLRRETIWNERRRILKR
jgi:hypothetical protein